MLDKNPTFCGTLPCSNVLQRLRALNLCKNRLQWWSNIQRLQHLQDTNAQKSSVFRNDGQTSNVLQRFQHMLKHPTFCSALSALMLKNATSYSVFSALMLNNPTVCSVFIAMVITAAVIQLTHPSLCHNNHHHQQRHHHHHHHHHQQHHHHHHHHHHNHHLASCDGSSVLSCGHNRTLSPTDLHAHQHCTGKLAPGAKKKKKPKTHLPTCTK